MGMGAQGDKFMQLTVEVVGYLLAEVSGGTS